MNARGVGIELAKARRAAALTQSALAKRIGTTQSAIARAETGRISPTIDFVERVARATGQQIVLSLGSEPPVDRRARVRRALGDFRFDPWERNPSPVESRALEAMGMKRGQEEGTSTPR